MCHHSLSVCHIDSIFVMLYVHSKECYNYELVHNYNVKCVCIVEMDGTQRGGLSAGSAVGDGLSSGSVVGGVSSSGVPSVSCLSSVVVGVSSSGVP